MYIKEKKVSYSSGVDKFFTQKIMCELKKKTFMAHFSLWRLREHLQLFSFIFRSVTEKFCLKKYDLCFVSIINQIWWCCSNEPARIYPQRDSRNESRISSQLWCSWIFILVTKLWYIWNFEKIGVMQIM